MKFALLIASIATMTSLTEAHSSYSHEMSQESKTIMNVDNVEAPAHLRSYIASPTIINGGSRWRKRPPIVD